MSGPLHHLFGDLYPPPISLIDRFEIFGYSIQTLRRMLIKGNCEEKLERIFTYPLDCKGELLPPKELLQLDLNEKLEKNNKVVRFLSNTLTNRETGIFTHIHGLVYYEKITPAIIECSKDRVPENFSFDFGEAKIEPEEECYSPVVFCIQTQSSFTDFFYELLMTLYKYIYSLSCNLQAESQLVSSFELLKSIIFTVENTIIPPLNIELTLKIGEYQINLPVEQSGKFPHYEQSLLVLFQVLSIERIIEIWEIILLNNQLIFYGCNDTIIYAVISAIQQIIFPFNWNMSLFVAIDYSKRDYIGCPTPFIAGVNKNRFTVEDLRKYAKNVYIVDLETDSIFLIEKTSLCECQKRKIFNKLTLAKLYYNTQNSQFQIFGFDQMECLVSDEKFKIKAKKMLECSDQHKKDKIFSYLIRNTFFKLLKGIKKFKEFIEIDLKNNLIQFNKEEFLVHTKVCQNKNCTLVKFYENLVETQSFQTFLDYHKKFDFSNYSRFKSILAKKRKVSGKKLVYKFLVQQKMHSIALVEILRKIRCINQSADTFEEETSRLYIESIRNVLLESSHIYDSSLTPAQNLKKIQKSSLVYLDDFENSINLFDGTETLLSNFEKFKAVNVLYGKNGFLRMTKLFFQGVKQDIFCMYLEKYRVNEFEKKTWQGILLKSLYIIKYFNDTDEKYLKLFKLFKKLNEDSSSSFPCYYAVKVIERLRLSAYFSRDSLNNSRGIFSKLSNQYFLSLENPSSFYRLIVNSSNQDSKLLYYSTLSFIDP